MKIATKLFARGGLLHSSFAMLGLSLLTIVKVENLVLSKVGYVVVGITALRTLASCYFHVSAASWNLWRVLLPFDMGSDNLETLHRETCKHRQDVEHATALQIHGLV